MKTEPNLTDFPEPKSKSPHLRHKSLDASADTGEEEKLLGASKLPPKRNARETDLQLQQRILLSIDNLKKVSKLCAPTHLALLP